jgi:hypothetical protein
MKTKKAAIILVLLRSTTSSNKILAAPGFYVGGLPAFGGKPLLKLRKAIF